MKGLFKTLDNINLSDKTKKTLLLSTVFIIIFSITLHSLIDYDFWFHYDCGRYIINNHEIPKTAISSWYGLENNLPWISHEWAFGLICYFVGNAVGVKGLPFIASGFMALLVTFATYLNIKNSIKHPILIIMMSFLLAAIMIGATVMRPHLILYAFTIGLYLILHNELDKPSKKVYLLIPLTILWVNLHGGSFILLFFFSGLFFFLDAIKFKYGRIEFKGADKKTNIRRFVVLAISLVCVALNAHGLEMYSYPFSNMSDKVMLQTISEWQPLNLNGFQIVFLFLPVIYFMNTIARDEKINGFEFILMLGLTAMSLKAVRFAIQLNLIAFILIAKGIKKEDKHPSFSYLITIPFVIVSLSTLFCSVSKNIMQQPFDATTLPSDELLEVVKNDENDRMYNHYNIGGYLTYQEIPVFIDGRADIYSKYNTLDFRKMSDCEYGFEETIEKYDFDSFLVYKEENLADYLSQNDNYELKSEDQTFAYYVKR